MKYIGMKQRNLKEIPQSAKLRNKLEEVSRKLKNAKRHLKSKKTQLGNYEKGITQTLRSDVPGLINLLQDMEHKSDVISGLQPKVKKIKGVNHFERKRLLELVDAFTESSFIPPELREMMQPHHEMDMQMFGDDENTNQQISLEDFIIEPPKEEQRDIRKIYISLADKFHPDKAKNKEEEKKFHTIMQRINHAYKKFDYDELYRMQADHKAETKPNDYSNDNLITEKIESLENEMKYIKNQSKRIQKQINKIKKSELGVAYEALKPLSEGGDFKLYIEMFNSISAILTDVIDLINDFLINKTIDIDKYKEIEEKAATIEDNFSQMDIDSDTDFEDDYIPDDLLEELLYEQLMEEMRDLTITPQEKPKRRKRKRR
jgi:curved DNA-binding protein CbpA